MKRKNKEREAGRKEPSTVHSRRKKRRANESRGARWGEGKPPHSCTTRSRIVEMPHGQVTRVGSRMNISTTRGSGATAQPQPVVSSAASRRTQKGRAKRRVRSRGTACPHRGRCSASVTTPRRDDHHAHDRQRRVAATPPATRAPPAASPTAAVAFANRRVGHHDLFHHGRGGGLVPAVAVRVPPLGRRPIGYLDLLGCRCSCHAQ